MRYGGAGPFTVTLFATGDGSFALNYMALYQREKRMLRHGGIHNTGQSFFV